MSVEQQLQARSGSQCELCAAPDHLTVYEVPPVVSGDADKAILVCKTCHDQIEQPELMDANHWRCLNDSMWSQIPAVQVMAWRLLTRLRAEGWPQGLLDMLYLDGETKAWAESVHETEGDEINHLDCNGVKLAAGDTVVLTKDLNVKGAGFTAKRGTAVRGISLVPDNAEQIEGRVSGQRIVILTKFVKRQS